MTDKELKKLNRRELLEILLQQVELNEDMAAKLEKAELERAKAVAELDKVTTECNEKIERLEFELEDRIIIKERSGTMAEAAMGLNAVYRSADRAAEQFMNSAQAIRDEALQIKRIAEEYSEKIRTEADEYAAAAKSETAKYREDILCKLESYYLTYPGLKKLIEENPIDENPNEEVPIEENPIVGQEDEGTEEEAQTSVDTDETGTDVSGDTDE